MILKVLLFERSSVDDAAAASRASGNEQFSSLQLAPVAESLPLRLLNERSSRSSRSRVLRVVLLRAEPNASETRTKKQTNKKDKIPESSLVVSAEKKKKTSAQK